MSISLESLELKDWFFITATLLGPILAVQAQKAVERFNEAVSRKKFLFEQLMATRAARLSPEHVRSLNMISLVFYGPRTFNRIRRSKKEQLVLDSWKEYLDHLNTKPDELALWFAQGDELFINLLYAISQDVGFSFDRVELKRGSYSPIAHGELEEEQTAIRKGVLSLINGDNALNLNVVRFPVDAEMARANSLAMQQLGAAFESGALKVSIEEAKPERSNEGQ